MVRFESIEKRPSPIVLMLFDLKLRICRRLNGSRKFASIATDLIEREGDKITSLVDLGVDLVRVENRI